MLKCFSLPPSMSSPVEWGHPFVPVGHARPQTPPELPGPLGLLRRHGCCGLAASVAVQQQQLRARRHQAADCAAAQEVPEEPRDRGREGPLGLRRPGGQRLSVQVGLLAAASRAWASRIVIAVEKAQIIFLIFTQPSKAWWCSGILLSMQCYMELYLHTAEGQEFSAPNAVGREGSTTERIQRCCWPLVIVQQCWQRGKGRDQEV